MCPHSNYNLSKPNAPTAHQPSIPLGYTVRVRINSRVIEVWAGVVAAVSRGQEQYRRREKSLTTATAVSWQNRTWYITETALFCAGTSIRESSPERADLRELCVRVCVFYIKPFFLPVDIKHTQSPRRFFLLETYKLWSQNTTQQRYFVHSSSSIYLVYRTTSYGLKRDICSLYLRQS